MASGATPASVAVKGVRIAHNSFGAWIRAARHSSIVFAHPLSVFHCRGKRQIFTSDAVTDPTGATLSESPNPEDICERLCVFVSRMQLYGSSTFHPVCCSLLLQPSISTWLQKKGSLDELQVRLVNR